MQNLLNQYVLIKPTVVSKMYRKLTGTAHCCPLSRNFEKNFENCQDWRQDLKAETFPMLVIKNVSEVCNFSLWCPNLLQGKTRQGSVFIFELKCNYKTFSQKHIL